MGIGTGGIPTTDNILETTEIFGCPTMNTIKLSFLKNRLSGKLSVGHPSFSVVSGKFSVVGIPPVPMPIPEDIQLLMYDWLRCEWQKENRD
jgi:hypothetical protein